MKEALSAKTHLDTDWIPLHTVEIGVVGGGRVEELPPQQLAKQGKRRTAAFAQLERKQRREQFSTRPDPTGGKLLPQSGYLHVELPQVVVQNPAGQAAEAQVGAEASGTGVQGARVDPSVFQTGHPHLQRYGGFETADESSSFHPKPLLAETSVYVHQGAFRGA